MSELPSVTVVTAAFNAERFVGAALDSALAQDYPAELVDLVVVDDGSTDETAAMVRERARRHPARAITLVCQANAGNVGAIKHRPRARSRRARRPARCRRRLAGRQAAPPGRRAHGPRPACSTAT